MFDYLFSHIKVRETELRNRIVMPASDMEMGPWKLKTVTTETIEAGVDVLDVSRGNIITEASLSQRA